MKKAILLFAGFMGLASCAFAQPQLSLESIATGLYKPLAITHANDARLFITQQNGLIRILDENGELLPTPFLNIQDRVNTSGNERGLLGLAFHPDYGDNGYFFVNYTGSGGNTRVSRFSVDPVDPNQADPNSEVILLTINQPFSNHNGGGLAFGPDGYLYIGMGDGGSANDPQNNGQTLTTLLGKMLRIDVDNQDTGLAYAIPPDNPFAGPNDGIRDEIWAIGMRNPWRFSFDRLTGDLWIGDVGQGEWEEIDFQAAGSPGGNNYGWHCYEGNHSFNTTACAPMENYIFPVFDYSHAASGGCSVTGGVVYRGCRYPNLYGQYVFADYCNGKFWSIEPDGANGWTVHSLSQFSGLQYTSFGEDYQGELYVTGHAQGRIYRVVETSGPVFETPVIQWNDTLLSVPSGYASYQWYIDGAAIPGAADSTILPLQSGSYTVEVSSETGCTTLSEPYLLVIQGLQEITPVPDWTITPNPFAHTWEFRLNLDDASPCSLEVFTLNGEQVWSQSWKDIQSLSQPIDGNDWPAGVYWVRLSTTQGAWFKRLVKINN
ncbi:MAG: PQQ-dependent sugar dehydrogenase [Lewinellaceae bacterium]|nr:PQQ-dependent sugar dehydrogenase [Lewinellaceae bacterium]